MAYPGLFPWLQSLNALAGGFFLLCAFGLVAVRQAQNCLRLFVAQSLFLCLSAFMLGILLHSSDLIAVGIIDFISKPVVIPWLLRRTVGGEVHTRREITQVFNIPTSLLIALALTISAYLFATPLLRAGNAGDLIGSNLPIGLAGLLIGAFTMAVRREAVPMALALISMENSAFFAGIAIAPDFPLIAEVSIAFDVLILTFLVGLLTRAVRQQIGTTAVGALTELREAKKS